MTAPNVVPESPPAPIAPPAVPNPSPSPYADVPPVVLIAPNVSEQMGGEALKSLHIWQALHGLGVRVTQVTHERVRAELSAKFPELPVAYVADSRWQNLIYRVPAFRPLNRLIFQWGAARVARRLVRAEPTAIVHHTSPISPAVPQFRVAGAAATVIGPVNGNIYFPPAFRHRENWTDGFKRLSHRAVQAGHRVLFRGKRSAAVLLVAGGERTRQSLRWAGCRPGQFVESLDSGIPDAFADAPAADHTGPNRRFVHSGRVVPFKGAELAIRAVYQSRAGVELTVIGRGPDRGRLERMVAALGLADRVTFVGWVPHGQLPATLSAFRGLVFPSMAEANGIVVQEAMMVGLPVVTLDYGGPALLVTPATGILVPVESERQVVADLAAAMDRLATEDGLATRLGAAGRQRAIDQGYNWSALIRRWVDVYRRVGKSAAA